MTGDAARRRRRIAAGSWLLLAFLTWNVRFDYGVRLTATHYLVQRAAYLRHQGPRVEMAAMMRTGVASSAGMATILAAPLLLVSVVLGAATFVRSGAASAGARR